MGGFWQPRHTGLIIYTCPTVCIVPITLGQAESHTASCPRCSNAKSKILISSITEESTAAYWNDHSNTSRKMANELPICAMYECQLKLAAAAFQMAPKCMNYTHHSHEDMKGDFSEMIGSIASLGGAVPQISIRCTWGLSLCTRWEDEKGMMAVWQHYSVDIKYEVKLGSWLYVVSVWFSLLMLFRRGKMELVTV